MKDVTEATRRYTSSNRSAQVEEYTQRIKAFLDQETRNGQPIHGASKGHPAYGTICELAGLPKRIEIRIPSLKDVIDEYADRYGVRRKSKIAALTTDDIDKISANSIALTFHELKESSFKDVSQHTHKVYLSHLKKYMRLLGKSDADIITSEFLEDFDSNCAKFVKTYFPGQISGSRSSMSALRKWRNRFLKLARRQMELPDDLSEAIALLIGGDERTIGRIAEDAGIKRGALSRLISCTRSTAQPEILIKLEVAFDLKYGTLLSRARYLNPRKSLHFCHRNMFPAHLQGKSSGIRAKRKEVRRLLPDNFPDLNKDTQQSLLDAAIQKVLVKEHLDPYEKVMSENTTLPYALKFEHMPLRLQEEINSVIKMKTTDGSMDGPDKSKMWVRATAEKWKMEMCRFFGFCKLPTNSDHEKLLGLGLTDSDLTLGLLTVRSVVRDYLEFRKIRVNGEENSANFNFLNSVKMLLQPTSGWLATSSHIELRIPRQFQTEMQSDWASTCQSQKEYAEKYNKNKTFVKSRDPHFRLLPLIKTGLPLDPVRQALKNNFEELKALEAEGRISDVELAILWRDFIIVDFLMRFPLRIKNMVEMSYDPKYTDLLFTPNGSNIRFIDGEGWGLYLYAKDFKNVKNRNIFGPNGDRDLVFLFQSMPWFQSFEAILDTYMKRHRPFLCDGQGALFPNGNHKHMSTEELRYRVNKWTAKYLSSNGDYKYGLRIPGLKKFSPHAFRHLAATELVIIEGNFEGAADILMDSRYTVAQNYARYLPEQKISRVMNRHSDWGQSYS